MGMDLSRPYLNSLSQRAALFRTVHTGVHIFRWLIVFIINIKLEKLAKITRAHAYG